MRKKLKKYQIDPPRPFMVDPDLVRLFFNLGESTYSALTLALIVQCIAHLESKAKKSPGVKTLDLSTPGLLEVFPFLNLSTLKKRILKLRKFGIWENEKYKPKSAMAAYADIRISWPAIARLAKDVQEKQVQNNEMAAMCRRLMGK